MDDDFKKSDRLSAEGGFGNEDDSAPEVVGASDSGAEQDEDEVSLDKLAEEEHAEDETGEEDE